MNDIAPGTRLVFGVGMKCNHASPVSATTFRSASRSGGFADFCWGEADRLLLKTSGVPGHIRYGSGLVW